MTRRTKLLTHKMILYSLMMLFCYVIQVTPSALALGGIKPLLVLPLAVSIAMMEGELAGGLFGLLAGLLCDISSSMIFGINSLLYMVACVAIGLLVIYYMQPSLLNSVLFTGVVLMGRHLFEFFFYYVMWGYEDVSLVLWEQMAPNLIYTLAVTPLFYWVIRKVFGFYQAKLSD